MDSPAEKTTCDDATIALQKKRTQVILYATGLVFLLLGAVILAKPGLAYDFFGMEKQVSTILGGGFMAVGATDFLIARFLFAEVDRR